MSKLAEFTAFANDLYGQLSEAWRDTNLARRSSRNAMLTNAVVSQTKKLIPPAVLENPTLRPHILEVCRCMDACVSRLGAIGRTEPPPGYAELRDAINDLDIAAGKHDPTLLANLRKRMEAKPNADKNTWIKGLGDRDAALEAISYLTGVPRKRRRSTRSAD